MDLNLRTHTDDKARPLRLGGVDSGAASIVAQNTFGAGVEVRGMFSLSITNGGSIVTLQRSFDRATVATDGAATWLDVIDCDWDWEGFWYEPASNVYFRLGVLTGDFVGNATVRIIQ